MVIIFIHIVSNSAAALATLVKSSNLAFEPPAACFSGFHCTKLKVCHSNVVISAVFKIRLEEPLNNFEKKQIFYLNL